MSKNNPNPHEGENHDAHQVRWNGKATQSLSRVPPIALGPRPEDSGHPMLLLPVDECPNCPL